VDGCVRWVFADKTGDGVYYTQLLSHYVVFRGDYEFGEVENAHIMLKCPLWKLPEDFVSLLLNGFEQPNLYTDDLPHNGKILLHDWKHGFDMDCRRQSSALIDSKGKTRDVNQDCFFSTSRTTFI
jgi:hypothetical protein